jgi:shikimate kinase
VGKTTAGAGAASRLGRRFLDFDIEIERREGMPVAQIFAEKGETHFRELERMLTAELVHMEPAVLAPGGGWIRNPGVVALVRPIGSIIYLKARPETVVRRMGAGRDARPLLRGADPVQAVAALLAAREAAYSAADHVIDTDLLDPQQVIDKIAELASASGGG